MKMTKEKRKQKFWMYFLISLCIILVGAYIFSIVLTRRYNEKITTIQQELLIQIELERRVRDTTGLLADLKNEIQEVGRYFKTPDDVIEIIEEIEGLSRFVGSEVSVLQVQVEEEDEQTREGILVVNILSGGSWNQMSHLLSLLDTLPYQSYTAVATLDTSGIDEDNPSEFWTLRSTVNIELKQE